MLYWLSSEGVKFVRLPGERIKFHLGAFQDTTSSWVKEGVGPKTATISYWWNRGFIRCQGTSFSQFWKTGPRYRRIIQDWRGKLSKTAPRYKWIIQNWRGKLSKTSPRYKWILQDWRKFPKTAPRYKWIIQYWWWIRLQPWWCCVMVIPENINKLIKRGGGIKMYKSK